MLFNKLEDAKFADINTFIIQSEFGSIDASTTKAKLKFDGTSAISTIFTYVYPIRNPANAAKLYAQLSKLGNVKIDIKNIHFSFSANEISAVKQKRRGEFGELILHLLLRDFYKTIPLLSKKEAIIWLPVPVTVPFTTNLLRLGFAVEVPINTELVLLL